MVLTSLAVDVQAQTPFSGTIIISSDGSINPTSAPVQKSCETYMFLESFTGNVAVQRDNVVLDGVGFAVTSTVTPSFRSLHYLVQSRRAEFNTTNKAFPSWIAAANIGLISP